MQYGAPRPSLTHPPHPRTHTHSLFKLQEGAEGVAKLKIELADQQVVLEKATKDTEALLGDLTVKSEAAKVKNDKVAVIKSDCEAEAARIAVDKADAEQQLEAAMPYVREAEGAIDSIKDKDIKALKSMEFPIINLILDIVALLFMEPMVEIVEESVTLKRNTEEVHFFKSSFKPYGKQMLLRATFLDQLKEFGATGKDEINEETIEFMEPYLALENLIPSIANAVSSAAGGLCTFARAMKMYHVASKIVKPKLEALSAAQAGLEKAQKNLAAATIEQEAVQKVLSELQESFEKQMAEKTKIEQGAKALKNKMQMATDLIDGLAGERKRWEEDEKTFGVVKKRLVGDCAVACGFICYCGPFDETFRALMVENKFISDCKQRKIPVSEKIDMVEFLVDTVEAGKWSMEGLPNDPLSVQNGILVTRGTRFPLLIDPQGQAANWIQSREAERLPAFGTTQISSTKLKDQLEFCMGEGRALIVLGVEEEIDPMLDPVLEKQIVVRGKGKMSINVADTNMDYDKNFTLYFITRLANPHFSPELQAKTNVVNFTVTQKGLEDQLLGVVIGIEQASIEELLKKVVRDSIQAQNNLAELDAALLQKLSSNEGSLLDDPSLIGTLQNTKAKNLEVQAKLKEASETKINLAQAREQYRDVAIRGSCLYFAIVAMNSVNWMYQTSLETFTSLFVGSIADAEKAAMVSKRVGHIVQTMTYKVYRYINRGLYEKDKLIFVFVALTQVLITAGTISRSDINLFLMGGAALDINSERKKPFAWLKNDAWLSVIALSKAVPFFQTLPDDITRNEPAWRKWYEDSMPEANMQEIVPEMYSRLETLCEENSDLGQWYRLLVIRSLRLDRTGLVMKEFITNSAIFGSDFTDPVTDTLLSIYEEMTPMKPVMYLLSIGADPTEAIEALAKKKKKPPVTAVSLGEGQDVVGKKAINTAIVAGNWVLLQNCELGMDLISVIVDFLDALPPRHEDFRLFFTAMPSTEFPLALVQLCTKVTNEPPAGLRAGIMRSYSTVVDQDKLERIETDQWRKILFGLCFMHSVVQERRKFGPLGWCIPYEYNTADLSACMAFLEAHLYNGPISWSTVQYMVSEVQYGGKITDDFDRRLMATYCAAWMNPSILSPEYTYNPGSLIEPIAGDFNYSIPDSQEHSDYIKVSPL